MEPMTWWLVLLKDAQEANDWSIDEKNVCRLFKEQKWQTQQLKDLQQRPEILVVCVAARMTECAHTDFTQWLRCYVNDVKVFLHVGGFQSRSVTQFQICHTLEELAMAFIPVENVVPYSKGSRSTLWDEAVEAVRLSSISALPDSPTAKLKEGWDAWQDLVGQRGTRGPKGLASPYVAAKCLAALDRSRQSAYLDALTNRGLVDLKKRIADDASAIVSEFEKTLESAAKRERGDGNQR